MILRKGRSWSDVGARRRVLCRLLTFAGLLCLGSAGACSQERYQLQQDSSGRTIRLDKRTGEVAVIQGDRILPLQDPTQMRAETERRQRDDSVLGRARRWPRDSIPPIGVDSALLTTAYRNGAIYYRLVLKPIPRGYETASTKTTSSSGLFEVRFLDEARLELVRTTISEERITRGLDDQGRLNALEINGFVNADRATYRQVSGWDLQWFWRPLGTTR